MASANVAGGRSAPHVIFGIHVVNRGQHASGVQAVLTEYGETSRPDSACTDVHEGSSRPTDCSWSSFWATKPGPTPFPIGSRRSRAWR